MKSVPSTAPCPCGSALPYGQCCQPLHDGQPAPDAERLMRSRYSAYVLGLEKYLLATWHASTRPDRLGLADESPAPTWLGLKVHAFARDAADHAHVEFTARFRIGGQRAQRLHEQSRFVRENGIWFYLDGTVD